MKRVRFFLSIELAALLLFVSIAANAQQNNLTFKSQYRSLVNRMYELRNQYQGHVHVCKLNNRPAIFINTNFGEGSFLNWTPAQKTTFQQFNTDLHKALTANTVHAWNDGGHLHVGTGISSTTALKQRYQGKNIDLYDSLELCEYPLPRPSEQRTAMMVKLSSSKLGKFNTFVTAIEDDFEATLGPTEFDGMPAPPPYFSGNPNNAHNCTTWMSYFLNRKVESAFQTRRSPYTFVKNNCQGSANAMCGVLVFNHPDAPHTGTNLNRSFFNELTYE